MSNSDKNSQEQAANAAKLVAIRLGHVVDDPVKNGDILIGKCINCLGSFAAHADRIVGTILHHRCDGLDKAITFSYQPMSEEFRKRISGPWKHPAKS